MASTSSQPSSGERRGIPLGNLCFSFSCFQGFEQLNIAPILNNWWFWIYHLNGGKLKWNLCTHQYINVSCPCTTGMERGSISAGGWRFSSHVLFCQTESLLGCQKSQSGLRCHDPCILEASPVGRSALMRDFLMPAEPFLLIISIANRPNKHLCAAEEGFSFVYSKRLFWLDWKHDAGFGSDYISLPFLKTPSIQVTP